MADTAKPYVWLQAASDADMAMHATVIGISVASVLGATARCPLITVNNGWTFHHGTKVTLGNVYGDTRNDVLRGNTFLMSDTPGTGNVSYFGTGVNDGHKNYRVSTQYGFSGSGNLAYRMPIDDDSTNFSFYITALDGTGLPSDVDGTIDVGSDDVSEAIQGVASVYLDDADPRKVFGLPYFFISHDIGSNSDGNDATFIHRSGDDKTPLPPILPVETELTADDIYPHHAYTLSSQLIPWPMTDRIGGDESSYTQMATGFAERGYPDYAHPLQVGRNLRLTGNMSGVTQAKDYQPVETLNVRTKWDWIAEHTAIATPKTADNSSGVSVPGYAYGDSTVNYRRVIADVWRVGWGSGTTGTGVEHYGAEIFTDSPCHLEVGQIFSVTNMNDDVLKLLDVQIALTNNNASIVSSVPNNTYFRVKDLVGQFCIRTYDYDSINAPDGVGGTTYASRFVVHSSGVSGTNSGQIAYDTGGDDDGTDNKTDIQRAGVVSKGYAAHTDEMMNTPGRIPTTTRFQLHVETINHKFNDQVAVTPMVKSAGTKSSIFEQLQMLGLNVGMRAESIDLSGTLRDTGPVGVDNIRKQVLLNIARTQWLKIMGFWGGKNGSQLDGDETHYKGYGDFPDIPEQALKGYLHTQADSDEYESRGKGYGGATNPRSYACLTIFNPAYQSSTDGKKVDLNPDGGYNIYRGVVKNLSFTQEAGRPDVWTWRMTFEVISNEKLATTVHNTED